MDRSFLYKKSGSDGNRFFLVIDDEENWTGWDVNPQATNAARTWSATQCAGCHQYSLWIGTRLVYPASTAAVDPPNPDLPDSSRELYREAAAVLPHSRRAAAALCRASLEAFVKEQTSDMAPSARLDDRLNELSKQVPSWLADLLDSIRHVGNVSLHGARDDDQSVVMYLDEADSEVPTLFFGAINFLADELVTKRRRAKELKEALPEGVRETIERKRRQIEEGGQGGTPR
jgi:hypothetical protein